MDKTVSLPDGEKVPALGLGTWRLGESPTTHDAEVAAVRHALELGYRLFDTAEMYGEGGAETVLGQALREAAVPRDAVFVVSKVYPHHADRDGMPAACDRSRQRLGLDTIDLYLLHWRGRVPLAETVEAFETLRARGAIRHWGVSNFDLDDLRELDDVDPSLTAKANRPKVMTNQIQYALDERGAEFSLLAYQKTLKMPTMAYCPLGQGGLAAHPALSSIAAARGATAAQVALAWVLREGDVIAIPKAANAAHLADNLAAASIALTPEELAALDAAFPPPTRKKPLAMV